MRIPFFSRSKDESPTRPISAKATQDSAPVVLTLLGIVFSAAGCVMLWSMLLSPVLQIRQSRNWTETPCRITDSGVYAHRGDKSTSYELSIGYSYEVNGKPYVSSRYSFAAGDAGGEDWKREAVRRFPVGAKTLCYVNPDDPTEAVLSRSMNAGVWMGLFGLAFAVPGLVMLFFGIRGLRRRRAAALGLEVPHEKPVTGLPKFKPSTGPVTLRSAGSPVGKFIGSIFFAAFWNGIVSIFVGIAITAWRQGHPEWFLMVFLIPFVVVGLVLIGSVFYFFLALFNPRPRLQLGSNAAPLGETVRLSWELSGSTQRIGKLEIWLEGREEARYQRGTRTYTDKNVFARLPVVTVEDPRDMIAGEVTFTIPHDTMHSFESDNNKIIWTLNVHGDIEWWPDIKSEFPFVVLPGPAAPPPSYAEVA